jgi:ATP-dependent helicase/nuclease subunit A
MDDATLAQVRAAEPAASTWLSANAGSGKTKVLTDRVARLLLGGAEPARILCLTYTKAAAAEMQNRLFRRLGEWAMLDDGALASALSALGEGAVDPATLARARQLFARALETPGGLKIQTIHAFCGAILRRFPLEAGVPPDFAEVDDRTLSRLRDQVLDQIATGPDAPALEGLLALMSDGKLRPLLAELERIEPADLAAAPDPALIFDLPREFDRAALLAQVFRGDEGAILDILPALAASSPNDQTLARRLSELARPDFDTLPVLEKALLTGKDTKAGSFVSKAGKVPTKDLRASLPGAAMTALSDLADRLEQARPQRLALMAAEETAAIRAFAHVWLPAIHRAKAAQGWLRFDDLIARTRRLLADPSVAQWVLFKLDGGIDHILVDEAQDTAPAQWDIIDRLVAELTAGQGARPRPRTLFVVGDRKQSIYSFQGADLLGFEAVRERLKAGLAAVGQPLVGADLLHSFRSSPAILRLVDDAFASEPGGLGGPSNHLAFYPGAAGRVDLWPPLTAPEKDPEGEWDDPLDRPATTHPDLTLARELAAEIRRLIDAGTMIETRDGAQRLHEGHILILVRRRKGILFDALLQACKGQGLAMAGADRLILSAEPAVTDILALLRFLALPEDDLSLAVALRSPLFGWSEDRLFRLAHGRGRLPLIARLRADPTATAELAVLQDMLARTDFLRPYELLERLLGRHDGRRRLIARHGPEAEEPIEALTELALGYEGDEIPTLDGFLGWLDASDAELKRQVEGAGHRLRIMTVHGAKGLEAPLVILPDTADRQPQGGGVLTWADGLPLPRGTADTRTPVQDAAHRAEERLRDEERDRLLYVALTRAERWLIVAGSGKTDAPDGWYGRVAAAMAQVGTVPLPTPVGMGLRHEHGTWPAAQPGQVVRQAAATPPPALALAPHVAPPPVLTPSNLGGAKALPGAAGESDAVALARGTAVHMLLEHLPDCPPGERAARAARLLAPLADLPPGGIDAALAEVLAILDTPALAPLFAPDVLAEVALSGDWQGRTLYGIVDRLRIDGPRILAVDFKTNRTVPADARSVPEGLLRQMGAYAHLLAQAHPGAVVETALLWTATGALMPLPPDVTAAALDRAALEAGVIGPTPSAPGLSAPPGADASAPGTDIPAPALS